LTTIVVKSYTRFMSYEDIIGDRDLLKPGELTKAILEVITVGLLQSYSVTRPALPLMIERIVELLKETKRLKVKKEKVKRTLQQLEKKELLLLERDGETVIVHIKNKNHPLILRYSIKVILDFKKKEKKWNGKWYMVFFDVPEMQRLKRDQLREFLKQLGFYKYQKSVYLFPYECEKEISLIKKIVEGAKYMKYIIAEKIEDEDLAKTFFKIN
jgi:CRISPR-associated endonuclease Cas2